MERSIDGAGCFLSLTDITSEVYGDDGVSVVVLRLRCGMIVVVEGRASLYARGKCAEETPIAVPHAPLKPICRAGSSRIVRTIYARGGIIGHWGLAYEHCLPACRKALSAFVARLGAGVAGMGYQEECVCCFVVLAS